MAKNKISINKKQIKKYLDIAKKQIRRLTPLGMAIARRMQIFRKWLTSSWRLILAVLPLVIFFYYTIGSILAENIDVKTQHQISEDPSQLFETPETMAFLVKREVDDKMWTPNLPLIFPASILDNMPNFQIGIISAVRDINSVLLKLSQNTAIQQTEAKAAGELLAYSPNIWLMSKQKNFKLSPSSNAQYRKAAKHLRQYQSSGIFYPSSADFDVFLQKISSKLQKYMRKTETQIQEHSSDGIDLLCDDLFYFNKGYTFAIWQISKSLGLDYKQVILDYNVYTDWTFAVVSLQKAAEFSPYIVRNGEPNAIFSANHLMVQNFYMSRAIAYIEKIRSELARGLNVLPN